MVSGARGRLGPFALREHSCRTLPSPSPPLPQPSCLAPPSFSMAMGRTVLHMPSGHTGVVAKLHPTVLFNICDSFIRRNDQQERVIGTLLGSISADGTVEIRNSYAVPHSEQADQVAVDIDYHRTMFELHQRVNSKEIIIGWYSTGASLSPSDTLIHEFYGREVANPVLLTVDTAFSEDKANIKVFVSTLLTLGDRQLAAQFHEVQLDMRLIEAERIGFDVLKKTVVERLPNDLEGLEATIERLQAMIDRVCTYVDDVVVKFISYLTLCSIIVFLGELWHRWALNMFIGQEYLCL
ncbi:hypothetical protein M758_3G237900 [Ceratodon purpureus]|nr:hypothetical protein M758_3G237900 [Ceratodon purpureus]